jgi:Grx4 family monothiol glutaredoxin
VATGMSTVPMRIARAHKLRCVHTRRHIACLASFTDAPAVVIGGGKPADLPATSGVYAVSDRSGKLQYVGISRNVNLSVTAHAQALGSERVHSVKVDILEAATKEALASAWKAWLQEAVASAGEVPPGNAGPDKDLWQAKRRRQAAPEIRLTPGKGVDDLTCDMKELIAMVVKNESVVAFIKGTRTQPQCGFSHQMLLTLNAVNVEYQVVNVLDEVYNPGLRDAIKEYSQWPTIPQLYVRGEFVGGSDIVSEMAQTGELVEVLKS